MRKRLDSLRKRCPHSHEGNKGAARFNFYYGWGVKDFPDLLKKSKGDSYYAIYTYRHHHSNYLFRSSQLSKATIRTTGGTSEEYTERHMDTYLHTNCFSCVHNKVENGFNSCNLGVGCRENFLSGSEWLSTLYLCST